MFFLLPGLIRQAYETIDTVISTFITNVKYQGMMMKIRFPSLAFLGALLLGNSIQPALADTFYRTDLTNCSISDIGNNQWKVAFDFQPTPRSSGSGVAPNSTNYLVIKIPTISGTGLSTSNFVWNPVPITELKMPTGVAVRNSPSSGTPGITLAQPTGSLILTPSISGSVTFIITPTTANNAYPAAVVSTTATSTDGNASNGNYWFIPNRTTGACTMSSGGPGGTIPPITEVITPDPVFKMSTATWVLNTTDVGDLPDVTAAGPGYLATIQNINNNSLCVNYVLAGVKKYTYALKVSNTPSTQGGRSLFVMQGPDSSQLFYNLKLKSSVGAANDYQFPASETLNHINLQQGNDIGDGRSQMCWTPEINLFKNTSTKEGMHAGTLDFIITPKA
ncbi:hypothetical protein [Edaphovirga cremea]|uniref:hypothetical protein n=1 Tax=Edaphovirga cremea TaxID=2267246 RepID=UPI003989C48A